MEALFIMIPLTLLLSGSALVACLWAIKEGQFDDVETPPLRILNETLEPTLISQRAPTLADHEEARTKLIPKQNLFNNLDNTKTKERNNA